MQDTLWTIHHFFRLAADILNHNNKTHLSEFTSEYGTQNWRMELLKPSRQCRYAAQLAPALAIHRLGGGEAKMRLLRR
jgi:hypothetical protein